MKRCCGRDFSDQEIRLLLRLIEQNPSCSRAQLSRMACRMLGWLKPDGGLKEMSCRVAMLRMHREGILRLPPPRNGKGGGRPRPTRQTDPQPCIELPAGQLAGLRLQPVAGRAESRLWNECIERYHYLGYKALPGAQMRYIARSQGRTLALLGFGAAAWKTAPRDRFIGWDPEQRQQNLHLLVNNARFLILPWVRSANLASKLLSLAARQLAQDWMQRYAYRPVLMETFVEERFAATCYKAANWTCVGKTQGRGKLDRYNKAGLPIKSIWLYPLHKHFRSILCQ